MFFEEQRCDTVEQRVRVVDNALWDSAYDRAEQCYGAPHKMYSQMERYYLCGAKAQVTLRITKVFADGVVDGSDDDAVSVQLLFHTSAFDAVSCCMFCLHSSANVGVICQTLDACLPLQCCTTTRCVEYADQQSDLRVCFENVEQLGYRIVFRAASTDDGLKRVSAAKCELLGGGDLVAEEDLEMQPVQ